MENVGTWNADYAILFFGALIAPFFLYFLGRFVDEFLCAPRPVYVPQEEEEKIKPIEISLAIQDTPQPKKSKHRKSSTQTKKRKTPTRTASSKPKTKPKPQPKAKAKTKPTKPKDDPMKSDAISALCGLGIKKTEAKNLVQSLSAKKNYNSLESLINDCFMCMNNV